MKVINNLRQPVTLDDGTVLAAAGTDGSSRVVKELSQSDQHLVGLGYIAVVDEKVSTASGSERRKREDQ